MEEEVGYHELGYQTDEAEQEWTQAVEEGGYHELGYQTDEVEQIEQKHLDYSHYSAEMQNVVAVQPAWSSEGGDWVCQCLPQCWHCYCRCLTPCLPQNRHLHRDSLTLGASQ